MARDDDAVFMVLGFPVGEEQRAALRELTKGPISAVVAGSVKKLCRWCAMQIWIGPWQIHASERHPRAYPTCPWCAIKIAKGAGGGDSYGRPVEIVNLGNPMSRLEGDKK